MSASESIASQLPYLRRFARVLTGSQASGDAYAIATLEAIAGDGGVPPDIEGARRLLFTVFLEIWTGMPINRTIAGADAPASVPTSVKAADRSLEAITPLPRIAFLLRAMEGFKNDDIAAMLGLTVEEVEELQVEAGYEIAAQLSTDVLIIEDEPVIAMDLESLVTDLGHRVTRIARTHKEAVAAVAAQPPGFVLADIHLADGSSGLEAVNEILVDCPVPVLFITAYPERLLTGARPEPTFLITKPFRPETVTAIISQALFFDRRASKAAVGI